MKFNPDLLVEGSKEGQATQLEFSPVDSMCTETLKLFPVNGSSKAKLQV